jgi:hypothetical protein
MVRAWGWLRAVAVLVGLGVLVRVVGPFAFLLAGIWGLAAFCLVYTRKAKKNETDVRSFRYNLCAVGILYLIPIGTAATFFAFSSRYISWRGDSLSVESIIGMQEFFENVSRFFSENLKLNELTVLAVLLVAYLLSCVLLSKGNRRNKGSNVTETSAPWLRLRERTVTALHRTIDIYIKYTGPIAAGLATLASLTLFGMHLGEPSKDLQLRVKILQVGYADVAKKLEAALTERTTSGLYVAIWDSLPPSYREAHRLPTQIDGLVLEVGQHAERAKSQHGVTVSDVERTLQQEKDRIRKVNALAPDLRVDDIGRHSVPPGTTQKDVDAARNTLNSLRDRGQIELIEEGRKKFTLQIEKLVTERLVTLTKPLIEAVPILEPLMNTFVEAADRTLQERIAKAYDRVVQVAMHNPGQLEAVIQHEAKTIVAEADTKALAEGAAPQAQQKSQELRQTLSSLEASKPLIDKSVAEHLARQPKPDPRLHILEPYPFPDFNRYRLPDIHRPPSQSYRTPYSPGYDRNWLTPSRPVTPPRAPAPRTPGRFIW